MNDISILRNIAGLNTVRERTIMYAALASLPVTGRRNVLYIGRDGLIYANHPDLKPGAFFVPYRNQLQRKLLPGESSTYGQGWFHRRNSDLGGDYGYITYTTNVPCASTLITQPNAVDAYAQTGGDVISKMSGATLGSADIGLQFDAKSPPPGQRFSVQDYMKVFPTGLAGGHFHWVCNQQGFAVTY